MKKKIGAITSTSDVGIDPDPKKLQRKNCTPLNGGVSIGINEEVKTTGIEIKGCKNTTKGKTSRGPMA